MLSSPLPPSPPVSAPCAISRTLATLTSYRSTLVWALGRDHVTVIESEVTDRVDTDSGRPGRMAREPEKRGIISVSIQHLLDKSYIALLCVDFM